MPLIAEQSIVSVLALGGDEDEAIVLLKQRLEDYHPDVRIVAVTARSVTDPAGGELGTRLTAVVQLA